MCRIISSVASGQDDAMQAPTGGSCRLATGHGAAQVLARLAETSALEHRNDALLV